MGRFRSRMKGTEYSGHGGSGFIGGLFGRCVGILNSSCAGDEVLVLYPKLCGITVVFCGDFVLITLRDVFCIVARPRRASDLNLFLAEIEDLPGKTLAIVAH